MRKDGTYKFENGSGLGSDYVYGNYQIKDSLIILDKSEIDKVIKSNLLVIRADSTYLDNVSKKAIFQIDTNGEILDQEASFLLRIDNRKKY